jgi:hypothetical protein
MQRRYLFFVKLCFDNMSIIMKASYIKSNDINTATNSCSLYMQCIHGIVLLHLFEKKLIWGKCTRATIHEIQCNYKAKEQHFYWCSSS